MGWKAIVGSCIAVAVVLLLIAVSATAPFLVQHFHPSWTFENASQIGDSFGVMNSVFSGLAFLGVIAAIVLQNRELKLQRKEIRLQRREMRLQRMEMQQSQLALRDSVKVQERSHAALENQADTMLLSTYMNSIAALRDRPRFDQSTAPQWIAYQLIDELANSIEPKISKIVGKVIGKHDRLAWMIITLNSIIEKVNDVWNANPLESDQDWTHSNGILDHLLDHIGRLNSEAQDTEGIKQLQRLRRQVEEARVMNPHGTKPEREEARANRLAGGRTAIESLGHLLDYYRDLRAQRMAAQIASTPPSPAAQSTPPNDPPPSADQTPSDPAT